ncbi:Yip1 family protein [Streptomyces sp. NPDC001070]
MAGFRNGRGRDGDVQHPHQQYGGYPQQNTSPGGQQPHHGGFTPAADGEPEYFGAPASSPSYDDNPGHTRAFSIGDAPDAYDPYAPQTPHPDHVSTYRAGRTSAPPSGPRLSWKPLLSGIVLRPSATFWQMRDHQVWGPALIVTFLYGLLAVFGFDSARQDVIDATLSNSVPWVLCTAVAVILSGLMLGAVTNALARQLGGDGAWAPTIGLAMLVTSLTDAPRLVFAIFLGSANSFVQFLGWATWIGCAALLTSMVAKSHDLPWPKALGAASIQLIALLVLFKLPVI